MFLGVRCNANSFSNVVIATYVMHCPHFSIKDERLRNL